MDVTPLGTFQAARAANTSNVVDLPNHEWLSTLLDDPILHRQVVLPGACRAISVTELQCWQSEGLGQHEIVALVNDRSRNRLRDQQLSEWTSSVYAQRVEDFKQRQGR